MTAQHRGALDALHAARPAIARLGTTQGAEDRAADLIEGWSAVETALRSLVGGSTATGQSLIRELRSRNAITFEQGNALAEFHSASERARRTDYLPNDADVAAARDAFQRLESGLMGAASGMAPAGAPTGLGTPPVVPPTSAQVAPAPATASGGLSPAAAPVDPTVIKIKRTRGPTAPWLRGLLGALGLAALGLLVWWGLRTFQDGSGLNEAVALYERGNRQEAAAAFERYARDNPTDARPHIYLARMARQAGNMTLARDEATKAVQAEPNNPLAHGEMARFLMAANNWNLAREFWLRALKVDPGDKAAQGYLGCTMGRLGRYDEARSWLQRAGQGEWSVCQNQIPPAGMAPPAYPPGGTPPSQYPPGIYPQGTYPPAQTPPTQYPPTP